MIGAILLAQSLLHLPPTSVGILLAVDDPEARAVLRESLEAQFNPAKVSGSCRGSEVCLEVAAVPIVAGKINSGWAVAARLSRRLGAVENWPVEVPRQTPAANSRPTVEIIEDTTASGELACAPCEEEKAQLKRALEALRAFAEGRYEEVGGLGLWVGPYQKAFLRQVSVSIAEMLRQALSSGGNP